MSIFDWLGVVGFLMAHFALWSGLKLRKLVREGAEIIGQQNACIQGLLVANSRQAKLCAAYAAVLEEHGLSDEAMLRYVQLMDQEAH